LDFEALAKEGKKFKALLLFFCFMFLFVIMNLCFFVNEKKKLNELVLRDSSKL